jgi:hypothetical protein
VSDSVLQDEQMKEMAITVTPADIAEVQRTTHVTSPQETVRIKHEYAAAILAGLDALVNKHEDSQAVYDQYLKPHGITEQDWAFQTINGQTEAGKKALMNDMAMTVEGITQAYKNYDWSYPAKYKKMKQMIDDQISRSDPRFKQYLAEYNQDVVSHVGLPADHVTYLEKQRQTFWKDVHRKAQVVINEPTMQTCDLSKYGGTKPK